MLHGDRIDKIERTDPTKRNRSKECMISHYWFYKHGFKFQDSTCHDYHDLTLLSVNISHIAIITVQNVEHRSIIDNISKYEATNLFEKFCAYRS